MAEQVYQSTTNNTINNNVRSGDKSDLSNAIGKKENSGTLTEAIDILGNINKSIDKLGGNSFSSNNNSSISGALNEAGEMITSKFSDKMGGLFGKFSDKLSGMFGSGGSAGGTLAVINKVLETIRGVLSSINSTLEKGVQQSITNQKQYLGPISSRLQTFKPEDSINAYNTLSENIRNIFTASKYVDQQKLLGNIAELVKQGIGYNLEDRAYLETIKDKVVSTFDVLDVNLNRIIRLQQTDLTRSQMGLEAQLTQFLNTNFQDTSYLNGLYDSVTGTLLDATSQMSAADTTAYLYNVQKWLSSLYALGISDSAISTIAQGLNYLGSGNVSALTGNDTLNTLFAMAAQQGGLSYAQLLTTGTNAEQVNTLLESMVKYLQSIANNTSSEVLRSEYGRIFGGFSVSDLRAIQNLTVTDISAISKSTTDYKQAVNNLRDQIFYGMTGRTTLAEQIENMYNNVIYSVGAQLAENEERYKTWVLSGIAGNLGDAVLGGIPVFGELLSNLGGAITEAIKFNQLTQSAQELEMFKLGPTYYNSLDEILNNYEQQQNSPNFFDAYYNANYGAWSQAADLSIAAQQDFSNNWSKWVNEGATDILSMLIDYGWWHQGTSRSGLSFSTAYGSNIFDTNAAQVEAASNQITGIEETLTQSLDDIYEGLFTDKGRPIKVVITDLDGEVIGSMNTSAFSSNADVEENYGDVIRRLRPSISSME